MDRRTDVRAEGNAAGSADALRECRARLQVFHAFAAEYAMFALDASGRVVDWNDAAERVTGYPAESVLGRHFTLFYVAEDRDAGLPARELEAASQTGRSESRGWRLRRDGSRLMAHSLLVRLPDIGGMQHYAQIVHDLSHRERLEERFRRVVEAAPSAMVEVDSSGRITMVNLQAERMFGYQRDEMLGRPIEMLVPERFRQQHPERRREFAHAPVSRPMGAGRDLYALRKDGSEFAVEIGLNPIETAEGVMVLSAIVDISDRKYKEQRIRAALEEKDVLLGEIHHRVKNNLQIVHSLLDLQSVRIADPAVQEMLRETQNRIQSMALIHQVLYQSRDFSAVDFGVFLEDLIPTLASAYAMDADRILLTVDATDVLLPLDKAVPCGLIVNELVTNSLKHAFPDGRDGRIEVILAGTATGNVTLTVRDDGVGLGQVLDRGDSENHGLKLVELLSEQLSGRLCIRRAQPTEFSLTFPLNP